jgi:hypothetical protein
MVKIVSFVSFVLTDLLCDDDVDDGGMVRA